MFVIYSKQKACQFNGALLKCSNGDGQGLLLFVNFRIAPVWCVNEIYRTIVVLKGVA
jgi:hypothetical protein